MAFLSMSLLVSVAARDRIRASGAAIGLWFLFVLAFDLALTGALVASDGALGSGVFGILLMLNPADIFRMLNIFGAGDVQDMYGLATAMPGALTSPLLLVGAMCAWVAVFFGLSLWRFR
jgi:Cu-processing system permease protein